LQCTKTGLHTFATVLTKDTLYVKITGIQHFIRVLERVFNILVLGVSGTGEKHVRVVSLT